MADTYPSRPIRLVVAQVAHRDCERADLVTVLEHREHDGAVAAEGNRSTGAVAYGGSPTIPTS